MKKNILIATTLALAGLQGLWANTAPTVVIHSAAMRPGTTLMDIVFRVNDPDDATVKTRALAFKDGVRLFANVIKPTTFVEGTGSKIGDAIPANANHTITWDVAADWDVQLGQVKFEVLAIDDRGLLPLEWITIPASENNLEITLSKEPPSDEDVRNALFWLYSNAGKSIFIQNDIVYGGEDSGSFEGIPLSGSYNPFAAATPFIYKIMNLGVAKVDEVNLLNSSRISNTFGWRAKKEPYAGIGDMVVVLRGTDTLRNFLMPPAGGFGEVIQISTASQQGSGYGLALKQDGTVLEWGDSLGVNIVPKLQGISAVAAGPDHALALKNDGTVIVWGGGYMGATTVPADLSGVVAIDAGTHFSLALKGDGTVVGWGANWSGQATPPESLADVVAISAGESHAIALKSDGSVVCWGANDMGQSTPPVGLTGVKSISAGGRQSLALKNDGTVIGWGDNAYGQSTPPANLNSVIDISAGGNHCLAIKNDGSVVGWGYNPANRALPVTGIKGAKDISACQSWSALLIQNAQ